MEQCSLRFCLYQGSVASVSFLPLLPHTNDYVDKEPSVFVVTSTAGLWFVKLYDLLMGEEANIALWFVLLVSLRRWRADKSVKKTNTTANNSNKWINPLFNMSSLTILSEHITNSSPQSNTEVWLEEGGQVKLSINNSKFQSVVLCTAAAGLFEGISRNTLRLTIKPSFNVQSS